MSTKKASLAVASFFLLIAFVIPAFAIFERDLPLLTAAGEKTKGVIEVENDRDSYYKTRDVKLTITARGLAPHGVFTVWLVEKKDGSGARRGFGVSPYSFTSDGAGTGRFINTLPDYELARWDTLEIRYHANGDPKDVAGSVVVRKAELWRAHPY